MAKASKAVKAYAKLVTSETSANQTTDRSRNKLATALLDRIANDLEWRRWRKARGK